jgi:hypothetical protein
MPLITRHAAVINPMRATTTARQQGLYPLPFCVRQPVEGFLHQGLLESEENLESQLRARWNPY